MGPAETLLAKTPQAAESPLPKTTRTTVCSFASSLSRLADLLLKSISILYTSSVVVPQSDGLFNGV